MTGTAAADRRWLAGLALGYLAVALGLAATGGALSSDVGGFDDAPSHWVTSLMIRDWLAGGARAHPVRFAEEYYLHYPKVAIGQWPPVFHTALGAWTLVFGVSKLAWVSLLAVFTAGTATLVAGAARRDCGRLAAAVAGLVFVLAPTVQSVGQVVLVEGALALTCTLAVLAFGRFLETARARDALAFGGFSALAILTKGDALALAGVPLLAILAGRRWALLRRPALWGAAAIVATACAPWYVLTHDLSSGTWSGGSAPTRAFTARALPFYARALAGEGGLVCLAAAVLGLSAGVRRARRGERGAGRWCALAAWPVCLFLLNVVLPTSVEARRLVPLLPALACGLAAGAALSATALARRGRGRLAWAAPLLLAAAFGLEAFERPIKRLRGYEAAARLLLSDPSLAQSPFLIASDARGEGALVAAVAANEERPGHVVLRATKVLGTSDWLGRDYRPAFAGPAQMRDFLAEVPVGVVLFDASTTPHHWFEHQDTLRTLLEGDPGLWRPIAAFDVVRDGVLHPGALRLFRQAGHEQRLPARVELTLVMGRRTRPF